VSRDFFESLPVNIHISDRSSDPITRKKYVALVEAVQQKGAEVLIFSSMHESGQRVSLLQ
jgi:stalled ribosome rescue protein Dom34